jgi:two-component system response regulator HydG
MIDRARKPSGAPPVLVGASAAMNKLRALIERVAAAASPVLITGEAGSGKALVARALHAGGPRAQAPFVTVDGGAPEALAEALRRAAGGTLFLHEVADLPAAMQARLLRVLQAADPLRPDEGSGRRLPDNVVPAVDVRCLASTHTDLQTLVEGGRFRRDLFFRLDVLRVAVPSLRERREDIPALVAHLAARRLELTAEGLDLLASHGWPGNVRELENLVERLAVSGTPRVGRAEAAEALGALSPSAVVADLLRSPMPLGELEDRYIAAVLAKEGGNKARAAEVLGIDLSTLYRRMRRIGE